MTELIQKIKTEIESIEGWGKVYTSAMANFGQEGPIAVIDPSQETETPGESSGWGEVQRDEAIVIVDIDIYYPIPMTVTSDEANLTTRQEAAESFFMDFVQKAKNKIKTNGAFLDEEESQSYPIVQLRSIEYAYLPQASGVHRVAFTKFEFQRLS